VKRNVSEKLQEFFKTNPTNEQLIILDDLNHINNTTVNGLIFLVLIFGLIIGVMIGYYYCYLKALLELPF
jgi:hypothetical protein